MATVEIKSNIAGRLRKIRGGVVYQNITSVLGELGQNAQRAGATQVVISLNSDTLSFTDNGSGCDDPQTVFELDYSGFGVGFGEGFGSVFTISDKLTVASRDWVVHLDIEQAMEDEDFSIVVDQNVQKEGFAVHLQGARIEEHNYELEQFILEMGSLLPMEVVFNGDVIQKKNLLKQIPRGDVNFKHSVENTLYEATFTPSRWTDFKVYYESRFVTDFYRGGATGNIILKDDAVTLKAPDRRDFVTDEKYYEFVRQVERDTKEMYRGFVQVATNDEMDSFADTIANYLDVDDYLGFLSMDDSLLNAVRNDEEYKHMSDEELMKHFGLTPPETHHYSGTSGSSTKGGEHYNPMGDYVHAEIGEGDDRHEGNMSMTVNLVDSRQKKVKNTTFAEKLKELANAHKVLWIKSADYDLFKKEIEQYKYYGFTVVIAHNRLYEEAYTEIGVKYFHDASKDVQKKYKFENVGAHDKKERRIMWLLQRIEEYFQVPGVFRIADIHCQVEHFRNGLLVDTETKVVHGTMNDNKHAGKRIYLNRQSIQLPSYRVSNWESENISVNDMRMLVKNIETISHELAHLLYDTTDGSREHQKEQAKIQKEIAELF